MAVLAALCCAYWVLVAAVNIYMLARLPVLDRRSAVRASLPSLSVIVAACNEADRIEAAISSLLAVEYPDLEIVLVDDRSTDGTSAIVDRLAARDPRVKPLHLTTLAEGWLGKVAALDAGVKAARGEWLLFTDADVHFDPRALAIAVTSAADLDHLCLYPRLHSSSFLVDTMIAAATRTVALSQRPWRAADPKAKEALGAGAFNLVRRAALARTPGFSWLKLEVADDLGLAQMLKQHGARTRVVIGTEIVAVEWYESVRALFGGLEKNSFAQVARFSVIRGLALAALGIAANSGFVAAAVLAPPAFAAAFAAHALSSFASWRALSGRFFAHFLSAPFGELLMICVLVRATLLGARRGGVLWRGTLYPTALLRTGARVRF